LALATGTARIVNDRHWATDVTAGLIVGAAAGYVLPTLMHYPGREDGGEAAAFGVAVLPTARRGWLGLDLIAIH
jgi:membrane-associated phospholipid phosphatase